MIDWNEFYKQIEPTLITLLGAVITLAIAFVGLAVTWVKVKEAQLLASQTKISDIQQGKQIAEIAVKASYQDQKLDTNDKMKSSALDTVKKTVPDLGDHLHDKLVESAVNDLNITQAAVVALAKANDTVTSLPGSN